MPTITRLKDIKKKKKKEYNCNDFSKYYLSKGWQTLRNSYIRKFPLCEECLLNNIIKPAEHVHHIIPFSQGRTDEERWKLLLDEDNLMSLCVHHHTLKHKEMHGL